MIGTRLNGRYRIEDRIGSGGMSTVYRAFDETLEREVAIKILHGHISDDEAALGDSGARRAPSRSSPTHTS